MPQRRTACPRATGSPGQITDCEVRAAELPTRRALTRLRACDLGPRLSKQLLKLLVGLGDLSPQPSPPGFGLREPAHPSVHDHETLQRERERDGVRRPGLDVT